MKLNSDIRVHLQTVVLTNKEAILILDAEGIDVNKDFDKVLKLKDVQPLKVKGKQRAKVPFQSKLHSDSIVSFRVKGRVSLDHETGNMQTEKFDVEYIGVQRGALYPNTHQPDKRLRKYLDKVKASGYTIEARVSNIPNMPL